MSYYVSETRRNGKLVDFFGLQGLIVSIDEIKRNKPFKMKGDKITFLSENVLDLEETNEYVFVKTTKDTFLLKKCF